MDDDSIKTPKRRNPVGRASPNSSVATNESSELFSLPRLKVDVPFKTRVKRFVKELFENPFCGCPKDFVSSADVVETSTARELLSTETSAMNCPKVEVLGFQPLFDESLLDRTDLSSSFLKMGDRLR
jgi:hypothetical protein